MPTTSGAVAVVEDDAAMRRSTERLLLASGYATVAFGSTEEFLVSTALDDVMAVVLDIHLGGMSGIGLRRPLSAAGSTVLPSTMKRRERRRLRLVASTTRKILLMLVDSLRRWTAPASSATVG